MSAVHDLPAHPDDWRGNVELTPAQRRVLAAASVGLSREQTADLLGITVETVKSHRTWAQLRLGAKTFPHAVALALRHGHIT